MTPSKATNDHSTTEREDKTAAAGDRVLVVDDDAGIREVIAGTLAELGLAVDTASSADGALTCFDRRPPDLLITDWKMPGMNGIDLVNHLKTRDPHLAAILMTGYGTKNTVIEAFTRGKINYYLSKPFKVNELLELVSAAIKERRLRLSEHAFRRRLENEIHSATQELARKNEQLEQKNKEAQSLYRQLEKRQQEVEETKNYLELLLESSVDAIVSTDHAGNIQFFSRGAEEMFGYSAETVRGLPLASLFPDDGRGLSLLQDRVQERRRISHFETMMKSGSGMEMVVDISIAVLEGGAREQGLLLIIKDIAERKRLEEELRSSNITLEKLSITDGLTGLYNHRYFQQCLAEEFQRARRYKAKLALIMLDLDDFKRVNDTHGHPTGDKVLIVLSDIIRATVREVDTPARYGGEEFAIILPETGVEDALLAAERLKETIEGSRRFTAIEPSITITASLGLSGCPDEGVRSPQDLIRLADKALMRAKQIGKNRIVVGTSTGERPIGRGERLTPAEKKVILRRVGNYLRGFLNLESVLDFLLAEIAEALQQTESKPYCAIKLMDKDRGLVTAAEINRDEQMVATFEKIADLALERRAVQVQHADGPHGPATSYPILLDWPDRGEEVVGVINIGTVPSDLDFFRDLTNQAALGIVNAKLFSEMVGSRQTLESKVNQLMTLSIMGMGLQRNALERDDFRQENKKLLARCLARVGFTRVIVYDWDPGAEALFNGVDSSLRGDMAPNTLPLKKLDPQGRLLRMLTGEVQQFAPVVNFQGAGRGAAEENLSFRGLGLDDLHTATALMVEGNRPKGVVFAAKKHLSDEDGEVLSMFVLHASMVMENLYLSRQYQAQSSRFQLIHHVADRLSLAADQEDKQEAVRSAIRLLTEILAVRETSVYDYQESSGQFHLIAYTSATAQHGSGRPSPKTTIRKSRLMAEVVQFFREARLQKPVTINDLSCRQNHTRRKRFLTNAYMGLPLVGGGRLLGVMNLTDKLDRSAFSEEDADLAQITAHLIAAGLSDLALRDQLRTTAFNSLQEIVRAREQLAGPQFRGRAERVAGVSGEIAELMGATEAEAENVKHAAWTSAHAAWVPRDEASARLAEAISNYLKALTGIGMTKPTAPTATRSGNIDALPARVVPAAMALDEVYLKHPARRRPSLDEALFTLMEQTPDRLDPDVVEALWRGAVRGHLRHGRRRLQADPETVRRLDARLTSALTAENPDGQAAVLINRFQRTLREEDGAVHGRKNPHFA